MTVVKVSSKYQVVIPKDVRERLGIEPGQEVEVFSIAGRVELVPVEPIQDLRGFLGKIPREASSGEGPRRDAAAGSREAAVSGQGAGRAGAARPGSGEREPDRP